MTTDPTTIDDSESEFHIVDDKPFFAPVSSDVVDGLLGQYQAARANIDKLAAVVMGGEFGNVVHYFIEGNCGDDQLHRSLYVDKLFRVEGAVASLNSAYWSKALALTDVYACMPQERKNEWNTQLRHPEGIKARGSHWNSSERKEWDSAPLPDFTEETVRATIGALLNARAQFMAERVDGIFRALSGEHVTNAPEAFGKRMIIAGVLNGYGTTDHRRVGYLHDLRCVIAKFVGRDEPPHCGTTDQLIRTAQLRSGKWVVADGGALKIRVYKIGTAHMEVHPDMAWRLNSILAHMHPMAIPAEFRQKPKRRTKDHVVMQRPLPFAVLSLIAGMQQAIEFEDQFRNQGRRIPNTRQFGYGEHDKHVMAEARRVVESIGGVWSGTYFEFDYEPSDVLADLCTLGCIPDSVSHQFYWTPETVASEATDLADIGDEHSVLEPEAGNGDLAAFLPKDRTRCVEISGLRCSVLKARGFDVVHADFLEWAATTMERFDRIVMNPPFSDGRWRLHVEAARGLLKPRGRVVAILPGSARNSYTLPGMACEWSRMFSNEFAGTSVSVAILTASRAD